MNDRSNALVVFFRKAQLRFVLPDDFDRVLRDDSNFQNSSSIICEDTAERIRTSGGIYVKGNPTSLPEGLIIIPQNYLTP